MCSRHVHILPRIKAYSILLFPYLPARVRGGNNGEICRFSPHEAGGGTRYDNEVVSMAARLTDKQKKKIVADYLETQSVNSAAKRNGVSWDSAKKALEEAGEIEKKLEQKKEENTADILAYMESQKGLVCEIIGKGLNALNDPDKLKEATPAQITTALGTLIDKWAPKGQPVGEKDQMEDDPITKALKGKYGYGL